MAFIDMVSELTGTLPGLSPILAQKYINRALEQVYGERLWSFLLTDGVLVCPLAVTSGSVSITQYSTGVTLDATASAALLPQTVTGAIPGIQNLQIRFGTPPPSGSVYSIVAADVTIPTAIILTLDRLVLEPTNAAASYSCYRCLVTPPIDDFMKWESLVDPTNAITIAGGNLSRTSGEFDMRDPQRSSSGIAYYLGSWGGNRVCDPVKGETVPNATWDAGTPIYELWPHPTSGQTFYCRFRRRGEALVDPQDTPPPVISEAMILYRAFYGHAYPFAAANVANFPTLKHANWFNLIAVAKQEYRKELLDAKRQDDETQLGNVWNRGHGLRSIRPFGRYNDTGFPIDANFMQSHLVRF